MNENASTVKKLFKFKRNKKRQGPKVQLHESTKLWGHNCQHAKLVPPRTMHERNKNELRGHLCSTHKLLKNEGLTVSVPVNLRDQRCKMVKLVSLFVSNRNYYYLSSHTTTYTSHAHTQKVFANMRRTGKGFLGVETSLFDTMLVQTQADAENEDDNEATAEEEDDDNAVSAAPTPPSPTPATTPTSPTHEPLPPPQEPISSPPQASPAPPSSPPQEQPTHTS
nr:hypothetical protein [Tanacetum cinerariifolium]